MGKWGVTNAKHAGSLDKGWTSNTFDTFARCELVLAACCMMCEILCSHLPHAHCTLVLRLADLLRQVVQVQQLREGAGDLDTDEKSGKKQRICELPAPCQHIAFVTFMHHSR